MSNSQIPYRTYPLSMANEGAKVRVVSASSGHNVSRRLVAMGLIDGAILEVVQHRGVEGLVVRCGETRWAIGRGIAHKVLVSDAEPSALS